MKYTLQDLPAPLRQQVEDFIEFLMEKYEPASIEAEKSLPSEGPGKAFAQRWRGVAKGVDPEEAKATYLHDKHQ